MNNRLLAIVSISVAFASGVGSPGNVKAAPLYTAVNIPCDAVFAVSDNNIVACQIGYHAFLWSQSRGSEDLGTLAGGYSAPIAISSNGEWVVGLSVTAQPAFHAFVWSQRTGLLDIDTESSSSRPVGVNNEGMVVGFSQTSDDPSGHAFVWTLSTGLIAFGTLSHASAVNDSGFVVGEGVPGYPGHVFYWTLEGGLVDLNPLATETISPTAVNNADVIVGNLSLPCIAPPCLIHAFRWTKPTGIMDIDPNGHISSPVGVSDSGRIAGNAYLPPHSFAFAWTGRDGLVDLGSLGGDGADAVAINNQGKIIGYSQTAMMEEHAFVWTDKTGMIDLGPSLPGSSSAVAINSAGIIVGTSCIFGQGCSATLWTNDPSVGRHGNARSLAGTQRPDAHP